MSLSETILNRKNNIHSMTTERNWFTTAKEILALGLDTVPTLLNPIMPKYGAISLIGSSDIGKSYFLLQLSVAIITGVVDFLGFKIESEHKSVIYLTTEDDEYSLCPRLKKISKGTGNTDAFDNLRMIMQSGDLFEHVEALLKEKPADLVVIDTFADIFIGEMNQANQVRTYIQQFKDLGKKYNTLIIFNHHCSKKNDYRAPHKDNALGSQGFESSMRMVLELRMDFNNPSLRHLCIVKGNYLEQSFKEESYVLSFNFEDGFSNTGKRRPMDTLFKMDDAASQKGKLLKARVFELKEEGLSYEKITQKMKQENFKISRGKVGNIINKSTTGNINDDNSEEEIAA